MEELFFAGKWWRFDRYEIADGYIRPADDAELETYEPFDDFQLNRSGRSEAKVPFVELIQITEKLRLDRKGGIDAKSTDAILEWCKRYGLLGILLHYTQQIRLAPHWQADLGVHDDDVAGDLESFRRSLRRSSDPMLRDLASRSPGPAKRLFLTQSFYRRTSSGSVVCGNEQFVTGPTKTRGVKAGSVAPKQYWSISPPRAMIVSPYTGEISAERLDETWARFFPSVPEGQRVTYPYPKPYSEEFWRLYAEPVVDFLAMARRLREAFLSAVAMRNPEIDLEPNLVPGLWKLNSLVSPVGPALWRFGEEKAFEQRMVAPTLIGNLAVMAQADLAGERRVFRCGNDRCRLIVVAMAYQTNYCSTTCRYAQEKRDQRRRQREREATAAKKGRREPTNARKGKSK